MSILKQARFDFKEALEEAKVLTYAYDEEKVRPPCVIIYPHQRYVRRSATAGNQKMNSRNIGLNFIVIGTKGTRPENTDDLDELIEKVVDVLDEFAGVEVLGVEGPGKVSLFNGEYFGTTIEVEYNKNKIV